MNRPGTSFVVIIALSFQFAATGTTAEQSDHHIFVASSESMPTIYQPLVFRSILSSSGDLAHFGSKP